MQCTEPYCSYTVARVIIMSGPTGPVGTQDKEDPAGRSVGVGGGTLLCYCNKMPEVRYFTKKWI